MRSARRPFSVPSHARRGLARVLGGRGPASGFAFGAALAAGVAAAAMSAFSSSTGLATLAGGPSPAAAASAHIYWSDPEAFRGADEPGVNAIGRANRDGTAVQKSFIANLYIPGELAVGFGHIYWIEAEGDAIARANLDGSHVNHELLFAGPRGEAVAVGAGHIYWTFWSEGSGSMKIARANLDGSHINRDFISLGGGDVFEGLALNPRSIYWTNREKGTIGRADLSGRHVIRRFIAGLHSPTGLALDAQHLYWAEGGTGASGRSPVPTCAARTSTSRSSPAPALHSAWPWIRTTSTGPTTTTAPSVARAWEVEKSTRRSSPRA
jgi:hypothetical protein